MRILLVLLVFLSACKAKEAVWPVDVKPKVRWWWMGSDVDSVGIRKHLVAFQNAGIGGVEITPIYGVRGREQYYKKFLSEEWLDMYRFTLEEAGRRGISVDMNTGTGWPFGGPEVGIEDAATCAMFQELFLKKGELTVEKFDAQGEKGAVIEKLMGYYASGEVRDLTHLVGERGIFSLQPEEDVHLIVLYRKPTYQKVKRAAPGGEGWVLNPFDKAAVTRYLQKFDVLGKYQPEHYFNDSYEVYGADWSPNLLEEFYRIKGYKLEEMFPAFLGGSRRVVADYRAVMGELLMENFTKVWTAWAHARGAKTRNQAHGSPANLLDQYAAVDVPEAETFGISDFSLTGIRKDSIRKQNDGDPTVLKFASSAANISGKKLTSAETFTWLTEHYRTSLAQCKVEVDQLFCSGINQVYFHGSTYSPEEEAWPGRKFYASVDMSPTQNFWEHAPAFFQYVSRVQGFLQETKPDNDFLLYFPIHDIWNSVGEKPFLTFPIHGMRERLPAFTGLAERVLRAGYDLDYVNDSFLVDLTFRDGQLVLPGGSRYKALLLPPMQYIPKATLDKILALSREGATVRFIERWPVQYTSGEGEIGARLQEVAGLNPVRGDFLDEFVRYREEFKSRWGGQMIRKRHEGGHLYFFTFLRDGKIDAWIPLSIQAKSAVWYDALKGRSGKARIRVRDGKTEVRMQMRGGESMVLKTYSDEQVKVKEWEYSGGEGSIQELEGPWKVRFEAAVPEVKGQFELEKLKSWTELDDPALKETMGKGIYSTHFLGRKGQTYSLDLGEVRESARVKLNGKEVAVLFSIPFVMDLREGVVDGKNELEVEVLNLPFNRIRAYDREGKPWRKYYFVDVRYKEVGYADWPVEKSGLLGPVRLIEKK
jgi:hypothetical protein